MDEIESLKEHGKKIGQLIVNFKYMGTASHGVINTLDYIGEEWGRDENVIRTLAEYAKEDLVGAWVNGDLAEKVTPLGAEVFATVVRARGWESELARLEEIHNSEIEATASSWLEMSIIKESFRRTNPYCP